MTSTAPGEEDLGNRASKRKRICRRRKVTRRVNIWFLTIMTLCIGLYLVFEKFNVPTKPIKTRTAAVVNLISRRRLLVSPCQLTILKTSWLVYCCIHDVHGIKDNRKHFVVQNWAVSPWRLCLCCNGRSWMQISIIIMRLSFSILWTS